MLLLLFLIILLVATLILYSTQKPRNYPPGPFWWPLFGCLPYIKKISKECGGQHKAFTELANKWNTNILGLKLGSNLVIVVSSYPLIKSILMNDEFLRRPDGFFIRLRCLGSVRGITCTDGKLWATQRSFVVRQLRNVGFGKTIMEAKIKEELQEVLNIIELKKEVEMGKLLSPAVINVLWYLVAGKRIGRDDERLEKFLDCFTRRRKAFDVSGGVLNHFPWLRFIAPEGTGYNLILDLNKEMEGFLMETINDHYQTWSKNKQDDLIYLYISEMKKSNENSKYFSNQQLIMVCMDLFIGGVQTTSSTLDFAVLVMILYPDVQRRVQAVIDEEYKNNNVLDYADKLKVPYIEAVLLEIQRYFCVAPIIGPRSVTKDTIVNNYIIPKNATVLINVFSVCTSKEIWGDPESFRPERFMGANGQLIYTEYLINFGIGDMLARHCIFTFFVELLRNYTICAGVSSESLTEIPLPGMTLSPQKYSARFIKRHIN